ncbi:glycosyltransferase [Spongisporangium articulatum]|uniref:Glycosyltransferase n=1 Tax=Spongisporangium articulatum TaxID=3362603 RepID=A0ABW8AS33_9ACTN
MLTVLPGRDVTGDAWIGETFAAVSRVPVGSRGPVVWPFTPYYSGNPFQAVLYGGFADRSMVAAPAFRVGDLLRGTDGWPADLPLVVHLHWLNQVLAGASSAAAAGAAVDEHSRLLDTLTARGAKLVWTVHNALPHDTAFEAQEVRLREEVLARADLVHVMSPLTAELVSPWFTLPADRTYRCDHPGYQGVYPDWVSALEARSRLRIPEGSVALLVTGALKPYKGLLDLLDAVDVVNAAAPQGIVLVVAGASDGAPETERFLARAYLHPAVRVLPGKVAESDFQVLLRGTDVVALPYRRSLNSGVLALALTFGKPVLLPSGSGSAPVVAADPGAAFLYDAEAGPEALVAALRSLLGADLAAAQVAAAAAGRRIDRATVAGRFADDLRGWADTGHLPRDHAEALPVDEPPS